MKGRGGSLYCPLYYQYIFFYTFDLKNHLPQKACFVRYIINKLFSLSTSDIIPHLLDLVKSFFSQGLDKFSQMCYTVGIDIWY